MRKDVEIAIQKYKVPIMGQSGNINSIEKLLWQNEKVYYIAPTNAVIVATNARKKEKYPGVIAITDKRIIFFHKVLFKETTDIIPLNEVKNCTCTGNSLTGSHLLISSISKNYDFIISYKKEIRDELLNEIYRLIQEYNNQPNQASNNYDVSGEIEKLFELKNKGIISEEEFTAKKKQLLDL